MLASSGVSRNRELQIDDIGTTPDKLTGRGGLALFVRYLRNIQIEPHLERLFGSLRSSRKGLPIPELFKQVFCFLLDGSSRHLTYFDQLAVDTGYAAGIETAPNKMASSHTIKRFFGAFSFCRVWLFRRILQRLFAWRLGIEQPVVVVLGLDTMPMNNDEADHRHGVEPTYKKYKGFQPLQMTWGPYVVDAVFRGGSKHSNDGDTALQMIRHVVGLVRRSYREQVPILMCADAGFFDQKIFALCEKLGIGYVCGGKLYGDIKEFVKGFPDAAFRRYDNGHQEWDFVEFGDRRGSWKRFRRAILCSPYYQDRQRLLQFARPDTIIYTNLGLGDRIDEQLRDAGLEHLFATPQQVIELYHSRGRDELVYRALKEFASETLPFKRFNANAAFYYTMLVAFTLYEAFKRDVCEGVVPVCCYPARLRRTVIDIAAKIVRTSGQTILKVTEGTWQRTQLPVLWRRSGAPPPFAWA